MSAPQPTQRFYAVTLVEIDEWEVIVEAVSEEDACAQLEAELKEGWERGHFNKIQSDHEITHVELVGEDEVLVRLDWGDQ